MQYITDLSYVIDAYTWTIQNAHIYPWRWYIQSKIIGTNYHTISVVNPQYKNNTIFYI